MRKRLALISVEQSLLDELGKNPMGAVDGLS
jgi:hypothetical protein